MPFIQIKVGTKDKAFGTGVILALTPVITTTKVDGLRNLEV